MPASVRTWDSHCTKGCSPSRSRNSRSSTSGMPAELGTRLGARGLRRAVPPPEKAPPSASMALETVQFEVFGKVQGVFFRKYTQAQAQSLGIKGWCANTRQGSVLGVAQGKAEAVQKLKQWLQYEGSPHSRVERCEFKEATDNVKEVQFEGFAIKHL